MDSDSSEENNQIIVQQQRNQPNIFSILDIGDRKIQLLKERLIMIVGTTRAGKSTLFNALTSRPMTGKLHDQAQVIYIPDGEAAKTAPGYTSVTLVPNTYNLDDHTSIADMAGYEDSRNHAGVIGVSYLLKAAFQFCKEFKFILVISESAIKSPNGSQVIKTLKGFQNMFKFKYLSEELKAKLFNAVSLVITRATEPTKHLDQLTTIAKNFLKMPETIMCGDILERIVSSNRFEAFEQATLNQACPPLKILDNLDRKKWIFMNLSEVNNQFSKDETMRKLAKMKKLNVEVNNEEEIGPSTIISLPFKKDFLTLNKEKPNEVVIFNSKIRSRINSFNEFKKIANAFIKKCLVHLYVEQIGYDHLFLQMEAFKTSYDEYQAENYIDNIVPKTNFSKATSLRLVKQLLQIGKICIYHEKKEQMNMRHYLTNVLKPYYDKFFRLFIATFCGTSEEEKCMREIWYIATRGFRQFSMLNEIDKELISGSYHAMYLEEVFDCGKTLAEITGNYLQGLTSTVQRCLFRDDKYVSELDEFIYQYEKEYFREKQLCFPNELLERQIEVKLLLGELYQEKGISRKALKCFVGIMNSLDNYHIDDSEISELKLEKIQLLRENIFKQIIKSLIHKNYKNLVLRICTYLDDTEGIFETYNKILNGDMKIDERKMILEDYAMYSMHHGELALARQQLRKRLNLENQSLAEKKRIKMLIKKTFDDESTLIQEYKESLENNVILNSEDQEFQLILVEIEKVITKLETTFQSDSKPTDSPIESLHEVMSSH